MGFRARSFRPPRPSGSPLFVLGSATTNAKGEVTFTFEPTWTGRQELVASATKAAGTALASATTSISAARSAHGLAASTEAVRPDSSIGKIAVGVLRGTAVFLWFVFVTVFVRVHHSWNRA